MASEIELSQAQRTAISAPWLGQKTVILSTAGSGKTLVLTRRAVAIAKDLVMRGERRKRLLCVCFNTSAADEMLTRITALLQAENLTRQICASRSFASRDDVITIEVRTFHGLGYYMLRSAPDADRALVGLKGGPIKSITGAQFRNLVLQAMQMQGFIRGTGKDSQSRKAIKEMVQALNNTKNVVFDKECSTYLFGGEPPELSQRTDRVFEQVQQLLSQENLVDFGDMIRKAVLLLRRSRTAESRVMKKYTSVLVDEFQDMSASQLFLCKALSEGSQSLTLVGDDDQQIYSFRTGTSWFVCEAVRKIFPTVALFTLPENRRCPGKVVSAAKAVIEMNSTREKKDVVSVRDGGLPVQVVGCKNAYLEKAFVLRKIRKLLPKARECGGRILLLFRTNIMLNYFSSFLKKAQIPNTRKINRTSAELSRSIGPKSLTIFALLSVISPVIGKDTFLWATTTLTPKLEESLLEGIILDRRLDHCDLDCGADQFKLPTFLRRLTAWYHREKQNGSSKHVSVLDDVRSLLVYTDTLWMKIKTVRSISQLFRYSEAVLLGNTTDENEVLPSQTSVIEEAEMEEKFDQQDDKTNGQNMQGEDNGYIILKETAREVDDEMSMNNSLRQAESSTKKETNGSQSVPGKCDEEDFSEMFSLDTSSRVSKRRKLQGIETTAVTERREPLSAKELNENIESFRTAVEEKFQDADSDCFNSVPQNTGEPLVVLSTIHRAKGTTFAYVFLCGADQENFPCGGLQNMHRFPCDTGGFLPNGPGSTERFLQTPRCQEERRLVFVAATRTVTEFTCTYAAGGIGGDLSASQSPFVRELLAGSKYDPNYVLESFVRYEGDIERVLSREVKTEAKTESQVVEIAGSNT